MMSVTIKSAGFALALAASVLLVTPTPAHADSGPAASAETQAPIPETSAKIWLAIEAKTTELKHTIDSGSLANVHHEAYAIRDLTSALLAHVGDLTADLKAKTQSDIKFVATIADRLDAAGDANDKAGATSNFLKLTKILADLRVVSGPGIAP